MNASLGPALSLGAALSLAAACGGKSPTSPPPTWVTEGIRLTNADFGISGILADVSALRLTDGRWRLFLEVGGAIRSVASTDGLRMSVESGIRLARPVAGPSGAMLSPFHPRAFRLDDGRVRLYFGSNSPPVPGIYSAISGDEGVTLTVEEGVRVTAGAAGVSAVTGPSLARLRDGRWRMYFSETPQPGGTGPAPLRIFSATSSDLLTWTIDPGVRIGPGAQLSGSAEHPFALANDDGSVTLFYFRNVPTALWTATSADGLTFTSETSTGITQGNDPDVVRLSDGSLRMYYNWGDDQGGTVYSARGAAGSTAFQVERVEPMPSAP